MNVSTAMNTRTVMNASNVMNTRSVMNVGIVMNVRTVMNVGTFMNASNVMNVSTEGKMISLAAEGNTISLPLKITVGVSADIRGMSAEICVSDWWSFVVAASRGF